MTHVVDHALVEQQCEERHEGDRHRQSVRDQRRVRRRPVIRAGTEGHRGDADAQRDVARTRPINREVAHAHQPVHTDQQERQVREHVPEVRDARDRAGVGEVVVAGVLRNRAVQCERDDGRERDQQQERARDVESGHAVGAVDGPACYRPLADHAASPNRGQ
ncbi:hypothetical protein ACVWZN_002665 [Lysobacter sp. HA35]